MFGQDARRALKQERKDNMRKRGVAAPDITDAFPMTIEDQGQHDRAMKAAV